MGDLQARNGGIVARGILFPWGILREEGGGRQEDWEQKKK
jgi:hypothetical protein